MPVLASLRAGRRHNRAPLDDSLADARSCLLLVVVVWRLCRHCESGEGIAPDLVEVAAQPGDAAGIQLVDPAGTGGPVEDEAGLLQRAQVLGDGRPADRQFAGELPDRARPAGQPLEDGPPGRVAEDTESGVSVS